MSITYSSYLRLDELLQLQSPLSEGPEHDELLFITIHQTYELWFNQVLHESDRLVKLINADQHYQAGHTLKRLRMIIKTLVQQVDILETLTPVEFTSFRDSLARSSGFQSSQFREIEYLYGLKDADKMNAFDDDPERKIALQQRFDAPSMWDVFVDFIGRQGFAIDGDDALKNSLVAIYQTRPELANLSEALIDLDEGIQEWRYRHVKMVERTIGGKMGSGGSEGAGYLARTLFNPMFPILWEIRSEL